MKNILFVNGIPDTQLVRVMAAHPLTGIIDDYTYTGGCDLFQNVSDATWRKQHLILDGRNIPIALNADTHCLVNQISEADTSQSVLTRLAHILKKHPKTPVFNTPEAVLLTRRDKVFQVLQGIEGVVTPQTIRFCPHSPKDILGQMKAQEMSFPVLFKATGLHNGKGMVRIQSPEELTSKLHAFALDGRPYYLIEFKDVSLEQVYHKYRLVSVQGQPFARHACFSEHWQVNFSEKERLFMRKNERYFKREQGFITNFESYLKPDIEARFQQIYQRIPLDLVGMDCALLPNGDLYIFELNANMSIFDIDSEDAAHLSEPVEKIKAAVVDVIKGLTSSN